MLQVPDDSDPSATCDKMETPVCKECPPRGSWASELSAMGKQEEAQPTESSDQHNVLDSQG